MNSRRSLMLLMTCYTQFFAVCQSYLGGLLCTSDGSLPSERENEIYLKLRSAGIDPWELFIVDKSEDSPGAIDSRCWYPTT